MKKVYFGLSVLLVAAAGIWYLGCSVSKDFSFGIDKEFVVSNYDSLTYNRSDVVDARKYSGDFDKYKSDLTGLDISSASYTITYFSGPASQKIVTGTLSVGDLNGTTQKVLATVSNVSLASVTGISQPLTLTDAGKTYFRDQLRGSTSSAILYFTATTNEKPVTFTVKFHFDLSATYSTRVP